MFGGVGEDVVAGRFECSEADIVGSCVREKVDASDLGMKNPKLRDIVSYLKQYPKDASSFADFEDFDINEDGYITPKEHEGYYKQRGLI